MSLWWLRHHGDDTYILSAPEQSPSPIDCGIHPAYWRMAALPYFDEIDHSTIDVLFITQCSSWWFSFSRVLVIDQLNKKILENVEYGKFDKHVFARVTNYWEN